MQRYLYSEIKEIINKKLVLISGPRQVGKTTLAKTIFRSFEYLNYDHLADRKKIIKEEWDRSKDILILDEIHKMKKWKLWLKGIYDTESMSKIIVTGSARLDAHKRVGDSMAGRFFQYHLLPLDLKELKQNKYGNTEDNLENLLLLSGFPEPFLGNSLSFYRKWRRTHLDVIIKQDLVEQETIKRIADLSTLVELMTERVGSVFSYNSIKEDLLTDDKSVRRWMLALENSYIFFKITPYSKSLKNSIKKSPKYYFYDYPRVSDPGTRLENFVALSLLKEIYYRNDVLGEEFSLHYLRDKHQHEVDFLICSDKKPLLMIEVKNSDDAPSKNFMFFESELKKQNPELKKIQLVKELKRNFSTKNEVLVTNLGDWLEGMRF